ncbi:MAG: SDR family oxidoreductase [Candidatus Omnitrophica bacterium]|nr:SDR family oxidoreductase [Candidatus Omnitrophota bacterium]
MKKINNKRTVIITGGNRGIGEFITRAFYNNGDYVLIGARSDTGLTKKLGPRARFSKVDVRKEIDQTKLAKTAINWTKRLDVYINCAGFSQWRPIKEVNDKFWNDMVNTNLKGTFWGCKTAARFLSKGGCIINISSIAGKRGSANNSVYCASKFGIIGLTQSLAKELGPKGIRVNAVCPVYIRTDGLMKALKDNSSPTQGKNIEEYFKKFTAENSCLGRLPTAEEIANVCVFLASDKASAITGQSINVDCGVLL